VLGNHDWWEDADLTRREFARVGLPLIDNDRVISRPIGNLIAAQTSIRACASRAWATTLKTFPISMRRSAASRSRCRG
jgi:hypothetical protein